MFIFTIQSWGGVGVLSYWPPSFVDVLANIYVLGIITGAQTGYTEWCETGKAASLWNKGLFKRVGNSMHRNTEGQVSSTIYNYYYYYCYYYSLWLRSPINAV